MANKQVEDNWTREILKADIEKILSDNYKVSCKQHLLYDLNIKSYIEINGKKEAVFYSNVITPKKGSYETDLLISEKISDTEFIPLIVIESKWEKITTHDLLTYNKKANDHKRIHKNLIYGVVIANCQKGGVTLQKVFNHQSENFDFVFCFKGSEPTQEEWNCFESLIKRKIDESKNLHNILATDKKGKDNFMFIERQTLTK